MRDLSAAEPPLVLSLDVGSSSIRASAYDAGARRVRGAMLQLSHQLDATPDGGVEADPERLWQLIAQAIDGVLVRLGSPAPEIVAVATSVFVSSVVGVNAAGEPLTPLYTYADTRNAADSAELRRAWNQGALYERTGCPIHASYLPSRLRWLRRVQPVTYGRVDRWISLGEYVFARLFGRPCGLGLSVASWSGLLNRRTLGWDADTLSDLGLAAARLGAIDVTGSPLRGLTGPLAARWPALAGAAWFPPLGDGLCSNLGAAPGRPAEVVINLGTSAAVRAIVPGPQPRVPPGLWEYRATAQLSLLGGALSNGGVVAEWLRGTLALEADATIDRLVGGTPPDGHGLTVLPFLTGERSPEWDDAARAVVFGLRLSTRPDEILRAGLEAVTYRLGRIYDLLRVALPAGHGVTLAGGGFDRSRLWAQMVTDVLGRETLRSAEGEATSRGAAIWALQACGVIPSWREVDQLPGERFEPDPARHSKYRAAMARQQRLYAALAATAWLNES
ncbi:MAG: gluconokinase [Actinobacteria bacterium]|nr:gluconokinase [Actinomycetota bacterium]